jgi:hypothetical protein
LDRIYIFVKAGSMLSWASDRRRTFNQVGTVEKVEIYGQRDSAWACGDGQVSIIDLTRGETEYTVVGREAVEVVAFE